MFVVFFNVIAKIFRSEECQKLKPEDKESSNVDHEVWGPEKLNLMIQSNAATAGMNLKARLHFFRPAKSF